MDTLPVAKLVLCFNLMEQGLKIIFVPLLLISVLENVSCKHDFVHTVNKVIYRE
jgi:hypothetical protein